jgi:hypothetical protein
MNAYNSASTISPASPKPAAAGQARWLNRLLAFDAATCLASGLALCLAVGPLGTLTGLPQPLLLGAGVFLLGCALLMGVASRLWPVPRWLAGLIVAGNAAWVLASLGLWLAGPAMTALGVALVLVQAAAVAVLALLEAQALRTAPAGW